MARLRSLQKLRGLIYVLDHCEALRLVLEKGEAGEVYNISSYNELENIEAARKVLEIVHEAVKFEGQRCSRLTLRKLNVNLVFKNSK